MGLYRVLLSAILFNSVLGTAAIRSRRRHASYTYKDDFQISREDFIMLVSTLNTLTPRMRFNFSKPVIENIAFKLHYQLTVTMLLAFVILVCAREYFGDHIQCISDQGVPNHVIQTYCFFMATFTIVSVL